MNDGLICEKQKTMSLFFLILLFIGVLCGSVYMMKTNNSNDALVEYFNTYFKNTISSLDKKSVFISSAKSNLLILIIIFLSGFFRYGFTVSGACIAKKGFTAGFTAASFVKVYGIKGMLTYISTMPQSLFLFTAMLVYASVSMFFSVNRNNLQKKQIILYTFITFFFASIFCITSFFDGYLTTTFMIKLANFI